MFNVCYIYQKGMLDLGGCMYHVIVNPASRTGNGKNLWKQMEPIFKEYNAEYKVLFSNKPGHIIELVKNAYNEAININKDDIIKIIAFGGDGTMNEVLQGIPDFSKVQIGYIPTGSSNDFARDMQYPKNPADCLRNVLNCSMAETMDIGCVEFNEISNELSRQHTSEVLTKRYFNVSCGIGYDAAVCEEALNSPLKKFLNKFGLGKLVYLLIAVKQIIANKDYETTMILDDTITLKLPLFLCIAAMNHQYEGGGFKFCPDANYKDGKIDICAISNITKIKILISLPRALKGTHFKINGIERYLASKIEIITSKPLWVHTDGEVTSKSSHITITCLPNVLQILK